MLTSSSRRALCFGNIFTRWSHSEKRLRLGSGEVADGGGWGFAAGTKRLWRPGISNGEKEAMGGGTMT